MTFSTEETHNASTVKWKQQLSDAQWEQPVALCCTGRPCVSYVPLSLFYLQRRIVVEWNFVFTSRRRTPDILYFLPASGSSCTSLRQYDYCKQESSSSLGRPPRPLRLLSAAAAASDLDGDLLDWAQSLEAVLPAQKKAWEDFSPDGEELWEERETGKAKSLWHVFGTAALRARNTAT